MNGENGGMETYLTIEEAAAYLKLAPQTIRKYVLNKTIPYRKVQKSVRFRVSEIEKWIDGNCRNFKTDSREGPDLFAGVEAEGDGTVEAEMGIAGDGQAGEPAADGSGEVKV